MPNRNQASWNAIFDDLGAAALAHCAVKAWQFDASPDNVESLAEDARTKVTDTERLAQQYLSRLLSTINALHSTLSGVRTTLKGHITYYIRNRLREDLLKAVGSSASAVIDELIEQMNEDSQTVQENVVTATHEDDPDNTGDVFLLHDANDGDEQVTDWDLDGFGPANTDTGGVLYCRVEYVSPDYRVQLFKDSAMGGADKVAEGTRATASGSVTLSEANSSGLTGTVTLAYTADDTDITVTVPVLTGMARDGDKIDVECTNAAVPGGETWSVKSMLLGNLGNATTGTAFSSVKGGVAFTLTNDNLPGRYEITNDGSSQLSDPQLAGFDETNTDAGKLYAKLEFVSPDYRVQLYKDSGLAAADLVASGTRATASGSVTLTASNSSGLTGTITIAYVSDDTDIVIEVPHARAGDKFSLLITNDDAGKIFSVFRDLYDKALPSAASGSETIADTLFET